MGSTLGGMHVVAQEEPMSAAALGAAQAAQAGGCGSYKALDKQDALHITH